MPRHPDMLRVLVYKDSFFPNPPSRHFGDSFIHHFAPREENGAIEKVFQLNR